MSANIVTYFAEKIAERIARRLERGSRWGVLVGALTGGFTGAGVGYALMATTAPTDRWFLVLPLGLSAAIVGALLGAHLFPSGTWRADSPLTDRRVACAPSQEPSDSQGVGTPTVKSDTIIGDADEEGSRLLMACLGTLVALIPILCITSKQNDNPAQTEQAKRALAEVEKLGPLVFQRAEDGTVSLMPKAWALLRGRWQSANGAERLEFKEGSEMIHVLGGQTNTRRFQFVEANSIRIWFDEGEPDVRSWTIRFSDDVTLVVTDQSGQPRTFVRP